MSTNTQRIVRRFFARFAVRNRDIAKSGALTAAVYVRNVSFEFEDIMTSSAEP